MHFSRSLTSCFITLSYILFFSNYSISTPPPPLLVNTYKNLEVSDGKVYLSRDELIDSVNGGSWRRSELNLNGYDLIVKYNIYGICDGFIISGQGRILSALGALSIYSSSGHWSGENIFHNKGVFIDSVISDSNRITSVMVAGGSRTRNAVVHFTGNESNTFTGAVTVMLGTFLSLGKTNGAIAVQGDIDLNKGFLVFHKSNQLSKKSRISVDNGMIVFDSREENIQRVSRLNFVSSGVIYFNASHQLNLPRGNRYFYIDEISFSRNAYILFKFWEDGKDFVLLNKKIYVDGVLPRITIYDRDVKLIDNVHVEDFNEEYWYITAAPEPSTYGAVLGVAGLAVYAGRRKQRKRSGR